MFLCWKRETSKKYQGEELRVNVFALRKSFQLMVGSAHFTRFHI